MTAPPDDVRALFEGPNDALVFLVEAERAWMQAVA
jgi:hypothetical protein